MTNSNEVRLLEARILESKKVDLEKYEIKAETHVEPSVGISVTRKKFVTKMKPLKRKHVQSSDYDSYIDED